MIWWPFHRYILLIDRLDNVSLAIGIIAKILFFRVCFFNASSKFQNPRFRNLASKIGICQIDYAQLDNASAAGGHEMQFQLDQRVLENELKNSYFYHWFVQHFRLDTRGVEKLDCVLRSRLLKHCLEEGTQAVNLARHTLLAKNRKVIYMPAQISILAEQKKTSSIDSSLPLLTRLIFSKQTATF